MAKRPDRTGKCKCCRDGYGFWARPCPGLGCGRQKPLDAKRALIYGRPIGHVLTDEDRRDLGMARR
jgi:hypothetical protein